MFLANSVIGNSLRIKCMLQLLGPRQSTFDNQIPWQYSADRLLIPASGTDHRCVYVDMASRQEDMRKRKLMPSFSQQNPGSRRAKSQASHAILYVR
jgi:hypothetical protein